MKRFAPGRGMSRTSGGSWSRSGSGGLPLRLHSAAAVAAALLLGGCAHQVLTAVQPAAPGFLLGLWHGFIFPLSWIGSLFSPDIAVYAVPNNGGWYDFGYFLGIVVFGVGARKSTTVYRDRVVYRDRGPVIDSTARRVD
jgi:hypothetical protein